MTNIYARFAEKIIKEQERIIGPVAWEEAKKVEGLEVKDVNTILIHGDGKIVLGQLVRQYEKLFGRTSVEVCKEVYLC